MHYHKGIDYANHHHHRGTNRVNLNPKFIAPTLNLTRTATLIPTLTLTLTLKVLELLEEVVVNIEDQQDGSYAVTYAYPEAGLYDLDIKFLGNANPNPKPKPNLNPSPVIFALA
jgi:hypothetical protein